MEHEKFADDVKKQVRSTQMIVVSIINMKTGYEIIALPLTNFLVKWVKKREETDVYDNGISYNPLKIKDI